MDLKTIANETKLKMRNGLTYEEAKNELQPHIDRANNIGSIIAKRYGFKFKKITFINLIR